MNEIKQRVMNNVKKILKIKGINYIEFAKITKWDLPYCNRLLNGKRNIGLKNLERIAKALNLDIQIFLHPNLEVKKEFQITIKGTENE
jgi:transcriptional regulator with XRE-family HTH domain